MKNKFYLGLLLIGIATSINAEDYLGGKKSCKDFFYEKYDDVKIYDVVSKDLFSVGKFKIYYRETNRNYKNDTYSIKKCSVDYINGYISLHGIFSNDW